MVSYHYEKIDAFTAQGSLGNPAACLFLQEGQNLSDEQMLEIATAHKGFVSEVVYSREIGYAVVLKESDKVIGSCGIYPDNENMNGELGWILHTDYWKHGYGTELGGELI